MPKKGKRSSEAGANTGPRKKKSKVHKWSSDHVPEYASDDDKLYGNYEEPDPESREYIYDDVDEFHTNREKILLDKGYREEEELPQSDEEEVLALDSEESDDEEIRNLKAQLRRVKQLEKKEALGSDLEDQSGDDEEEGLPDQKAWGSRRSKYYGDDDINMKDMEDEDAEAVLEEKEALRLQKQMAEQLDDQDFGLDIFQPSQKEKESVEKEEKIVKDLSKLSKREKLKLLKKESPELLTLIEDFKTKMAEVQEKLCPLKDWIGRKEIKGRAVDYVHTKLKLNLNYCTNIVFYLMLKAKQAPVHNHPVIKRLLQYRNIMKQLEPLDDQMRDEIDEIVEKLSKGEDVDFDKNVDQPRTFVKRKEKKDKKIHTKKGIELVSVSEDGKQDKKNEKRYETKDEKEALEYYEMMKAGRPEHSDEEGEQDEESGAEGAEYNEYDAEELDEDGKRGISYQIEKNKGLTAHKKELRNPRVKHRMKYRKAKIRRKGQYREPRTEMQKYGGEISGIRAGIKRGVKLK
ncbi:something about silencing protein 10-like isoform X2 [Mercenaria mercenaria]|uniref:something about silencing protein 10-like isoform X2 n=1 Tax=Mercenaria mercenaria TaxID=6596 RepID=UPI00234EAD77|nr:something about silencing protein 10-like isoform X2 [Mercenaria mercenaria]